MISAACQHNNCKKHGKDKAGNQRYRCRSCGVTFIDYSGKMLGKSRLPEDRAIMCLRLLLEGNSIRSASRLTSTDKNAIIGLAVEIGERCERFRRETYKNLSVEDVQCDEIWGFVGCKEKTRLLL